MYCIQIISQYLARRWNTFCLMKWPIIWRRNGAFCLLSLNEMKTHFLHFGTKKSHVFQRINMKSTTFIWYLIRFTCDQCKWQRYEYTWYASLKLTIGFTNDLRIGNTKFYSMTSALSTVNPHLRFTTYCLQCHFKSNLHTKQLQRTVF